MNITDLDYVNNVPRETKKDTDFTGWIGSALMVLFSFTFFVPFAIVGLSLLTIQAVNAKMNNLVILNVVSLIGFTYNFIGL
jgi:hypothetical protein